MTESALDAIEEKGRWDKAYIRKSLLRLLFMH